MDKLIDIALIENEIFYMENMNDFNVSISYFMEAEGSENKIVKAIKTLIEKIKEMYEKAKNKVKEITTSIVYKNRVDKLEKTLNANPKLKNIKIKIKKFILL